MKYYVAISLLCWIAFGQPVKKISLNGVPDKSIDTSKYAILKFDQKKDGDLFGPSVKPATLSNSDIANIERLISKKVTEYDKSEEKGIYPLVIKNPERYYKQFIAVTDPKGEKIVMVNCLCHKPYGNWKKGIVIVEDGGSCFFKLKINLTTNTVIGFWVNGVA